MPILPSTKKLTAGVLAVSLMLQSVLPIVVLAQTGSSNPNADDVQFRRVDTTGEPDPEEFLRRGTEFEDIEARAFDNRVAQVLQPYLPGASCGGASAGGSTSGGGVMAGIMKSALGKVLKQFEGQELGGVLDQIRDLFREEIKHEISTDPEVRAAWDRHRAGERDLNIDPNTGQPFLSDEERITFDEAQKASFADAVSTQTAQELDAFNAGLIEANTSGAFTESAEFADAVNFDAQLGVDPSVGLDFANSVQDLSSGGLLDSLTNGVSGFFRGLGLGNILNNSLVQGIIGAAPLGGIINAGISAISGGGALSGADASLAAGAEQGATGAEGGAGLFVPVLDAASVGAIKSGFSSTNSKLGSIIKIEGRQDAKLGGILADQDRLVQKEFCLDGIAKGLMSVVIQTVKNMIIKWILTGNFEKPFFSVNIEADLKKSAENALRIFASKLTGVDFCNYFPQVPTIPNFPFNFRFGLECSLQKPLGAYIQGLEFPETQNINDRILALFPENDPLEVQLEIARRAAQEAAVAKENLRDEYLAGGGFRGERNAKGEITTPGSGVKRIFEQPIESETRNRDLADEIGEAVAQIINTVIGKVVNGGINKIFKK